MEEKKYTTTFVRKGDVFPTIGSTCKVCGRGEIKDSQYGGVYCGGCKWKWRESKFDDNSTAPNQEPKVDKLEAIHRMLIIMDEKLNQLLNEKE